MELIKLDFGEQSLYSVTSIGNSAFQYNQLKKVHPSSRFGITREAICSAVTSRATEVLRVTIASKRPATIGDAGVQLTAQQEASVVIHNTR